LKKEIIVKEQKCQQTLNKNKDDDEDDDNEGQNKTKINDDNSENDIDSSEFELSKNRNDIKQLSKLFPEYRLLRIKFKEYTKIIHDRVRIEKTKRKILSDEFFERILKKDQDTDEFICLKNT